VITVFTDASVRRGKPGGIGVVIHVDPPLVSTRLVLPFQIPAPDGYTSNETEVLAVLAASTIIRGLQDVLDMTNTIITVRSDSSAAVTSLMYPQKIKSRTARALAKNTREALDRLRSDRVIFGWHVKKIRRDQNPADVLASRARQLYGSATTWLTQTTKTPRSTHQSSSTG
jgi:ribonuclease HI